MCGICAFYDPQLENKDQVIEQMMDTIVHRGPSSAGKFTNDKVALGFRRLSIIDLRGGSQPIFNEDKSRAVIFNGEIYNFKPLREELLLRQKLIQKYYCMAMKSGVWMVC